MIELQMNGNNNKAFQKQQRRICSLFGDKEKYLTGHKSTIYKIKD